MTVKQKQCLLAYLGYYAGDINGEWDQLCQIATKAFQADYGDLEVDGIFGTQTEKAILFAVASGMPVKETTENFWDGIHYFKRSEFKCKCGKCGGFPVEPDEELVKLLETIRKHFNAPVIITSGIRCKAHNASAAVGGATNSQHLYGTAADIVVKGASPAKVVSYVETLLPNTGGIGTYSTFTHVDVRKNKSRWNG